MNSFKPTDQHRSSMTRFIISIIAAIVITCHHLLLLLTPSSSFINAFVGESPIANLDAADLVPPSLADFDLRIKRYNEWMNQSTNLERGLFVPFELVRERTASSSSPIADFKSKNTFLAVENENAASNEINSNDDGNSFLPHQRVHHYHLKMIAKRNIGTRQPEVRIPMKMIFSYHTICPNVAKRRVLRSRMQEKRQNLDRSTSSSLRQQREELDKEERELLKMDLADNEPFCVVSEYLYDEAEKQETCSIHKEAGRFETGFEQTMLSLFLAYARWGNHSGLSKHTTSPAYDFFKPMIDLFPRVPSSPVCTFTEQDLSIFPQATQIRIARAKVESQWSQAILGRVFVSSSSQNETNSGSEEQQQQQLIRNLFQTMFPNDALTLPRFFWASCAVKSRLASCFTSGVPCIFPVLDLAEYRSELTTYTPKITDWNKIRGFKVLLAHVEAPGEGSNTYDSVDGGEHRRDGRGDADESKASTTTSANDDSSSKRDASEDSLKKNKKKRLRKLRTTSKDESTTTSSSLSSNEKQTQQQQRQQNPRGLLKVSPRDNFFHSVAVNDNTSMVMGLLQFDTPILSGHELRLDRERRALPFLSHGIIDRNENLKCVTVNLPTKSMHNKYIQEIVNKADQLKKISPKTIFDDPADIHIAPLYSECLEAIFEKSETAVRNNDDHDDDDENDNDDEDSISKGQQQRQKQHQPYTCLHTNENAVYQLANWITTIGLFDQACTLKTLETEKIIEPTPENALRSVALLGKLVRSQLERVSKSLSKIEPYVSKYRIGDGESSSFSSATGESLVESSTSSVGLKKTKQDEDDAKSNSNNNDDKNDSSNPPNKKKKKSARKRTEEALRQYRKMIEEDQKRKNIFFGDHQQQQTHSQSKTALINNDDHRQEQEVIIASSNEDSQRQQQQETETIIVSNNNNDEDYHHRDTATTTTNTPSKFLVTTSLQDLSSCSQESPSKCRILQEPSSPRHTLLIHEWLLNEHDGLLKIYDTLTKLRDVLRKEIVAAENAKVLSSYR